jgi:NAD-dependent SIR2 family protein deacetylase
LREDPAWVPRCPACKQSCLRPNVLIFQDDMFVDARRRRQSKQKDAFNQRVERTGGNLAVLEVGAVRKFPFWRQF